MGACKKVQRQDVRSETTYKHPMDADTDFTSHLWPKKFMLTLEATDLCLKFSHTDVCSDQKVPRNLLGLQ